MEKSTMAGIEPAFQGLQVIAFTDQLPCSKVSIGQPEEPELGKGWLLLGWAHVSKDHCARVDCGVRLYCHVVFERFPFGRVGNLSTSPINIEFPPMVHAAQPRIFISPKEHGCTTVRAVGLNEPNLSV